MKNLLNKLVGGCTKKNKVQYKLKFWIWKNKLIQYNYFLYLFDFI